MGKLRCNESSFFRHIIVICLLVLLRKLHQTEIPKTVQLLRIFQCRSFMEQTKEFAKSKQAGWDRVKIRSTKYLFCCKIAGLLENYYHKCALVYHGAILNARGSVIVRTYSSLPNK